jgi:hypothetical protein
MKRILNRLPGNERGVVLIIVLILLAVGGLTIAPMLSHMSTGLKAGQTYEKKTDEYYAADAGVEDALWQITREQRVPEFPSEEGDQWPYTIDGINGKTVDITIEYFLNGDADGNDVYKINSTATGAGGGNTAIESYAVFGGGFAFLLDNAITSPGDVTLMPGVVVNGDVLYNGELDDSDGKATINGEQDDTPITNWPTTDVFSDFYWQDVDGLTCVPDGHIIDITGGTEADPYLIGPICSEGALTITGTGVARLEGTVYVGTLYSKAGDFNLTPGCTLLLNGQTIFAEGEINFQPSCITSEEGCVIAVGDINYQPNLSGENFVLLLSIEGTVQLKPSAGSFWGCIAGNASVELMPGATLNYVAPTEGGINFPGLDEDDYTGWDLEVRTWETS